MRRIPHIVLMLVLVVSSFSTVLSKPDHTSLASNQDATPAAVERGIELRTLVRGDVRADVGTEAEVILSRLILAPEDSFELEMTQVPTLVFAVDASVNIVDPFGFSTALSGDAGMALPGGTGFTIAATGETGAEVLVVQIRESNSAGASGAGESFTTSTPVTLFAGSSFETLATQPAEMLTGTANLFLSEATIGAETEPSSFVHTGAVGMYVNSGSVISVSPSGLEGQVGEGNGFTIAGGADLVIGSTAGAVVYLFGIADAEEEPLTEITPTPTPTTPTPVPPTPTPVPPTPTPIPPTPTPKLPTGTGTVLQMGETWVASNADVILELGSIERSNDTPNKQSIPVITLKFSYTNTAEARQDFVVSEDQFRIIDDNGVAWHFQSGDTFVNQRILVDPGETVTFIARFVPTNSEFSGDTDLHPDKYIANIQFYFLNIGGIERMTWGMTLDRGNARTHVFEAELDPDMVVNQLGTPVPQSPTTLAPTPTPAPLTDEKSVLQLGEAWVAPEGTMKIDVVSAEEHSGVPFVEFQIELINTTSESTSFVFHSDFASETHTPTIWMRDDFGNEWFVLIDYHTPNSTQLSLDPIEIVLMPSERVTFNRIMTPVSDQFESKTTHLQIGFRDIFGVEQASWGFVYDQESIRDHSITIAALPTTQLAATKAPIIEDQSPPVAAIAPANTDIFSLLPTAAEVPSHVVFALDQDRTLAEMTQYHANPAATMMRIGKRSSGFCLYASRYGLARKATQVTDSIRFTPGIGNSPMAKRYAMEMTSKSGTGAASSSKVASKFPVQLRRSGLD